jgi:integrase/recombinase XerD
VDGAGLRLVASAPATAVVAPSDPGAYQARCIEDYQSSQAARGFSTLTIDNGTATLERFLAACGRPA